MIQTYCSFFVTVGIYLAIVQSSFAESARLHHIHINSTDTNKSIEYYERVFGAVPIKFRGVSDALFTERSYILLNKVSTPPAYEQKSGLWHIGWGGVDVPNQYEWLKARGEKFHTHLYRAPGIHVMYLSDPDGVMIEINTVQPPHHRFHHIHFLSRDVNASAQWYGQHLGLTVRSGGPNPVEGPSAQFRSWPEFHAAGRRAWMSSIKVDTINLYFHNMPYYTPGPEWWRFEPLTEFEPQRGRVIDHIAFSFRDIEPVFERMKEAGVEIVEPITFKEEFRLKSFYVMGPEKVTIEIVEAKPIPEGTWD